MVDIERTTVAGDGLDCFGVKLPLVSSREAFEKFVPKGKEINDDSARDYLNYCGFPSHLCCNEVSLEMARVRLRLMQELADQEDLIMEMERRYKGLVAANHLGGVLHGWDGGTLTQKKSLECLPKELRKFHAEITKQKDHAFSFTSVTSAVYTQRQGLVEHLNHFLNGHSAGSSPAQLNAPVTKSPPASLRVSNPPATASCCSKTILGEPRSQARRSDRRQDQSVAVALRTACSRVSTPSRNSPLGKISRQKNEQRGSLDTFGTTTSDASGEHQRGELVLPTGTPSSAASTFANVDLDKHQCTFTAADGADALTTPSIEERATENNSVRDFVALPSGIIATENVTQDTETSDKNAVDGLTAPPAPCATYAATKRRRQSGGAPSEKDFKAPGRSMNVSVRRKVVSTSAASRRRGSTVSSPGTAEDSEKRTELRKRSGDQQKVPHELKASERHQQTNVLEASSTEEERQLHRGVEAVKPLKTARTTKKK